MLALSQEPRVDDISAYVFVCTFFGFLDQTTGAKSYSTLLWSITLIVHHKPDQTNLPAVQSLYYMNGYGHA